MKYGNGKGKVLKITPIGKMEFDLPSDDNEPLVILICMDYRDLELLSKELNIQIESTYYGGFYIKIKKGDLKIMFLGV